MFTSLQKFEYVQLQAAKNSEWVTLVTVTVNYKYVLHRRGCVDLVSVTRSRLFYRL